MVAIIHLPPDAHPPAGAPYVVVEWRNRGTGATVVREPSGLRYLIGPDNRLFWTREAPHLARRMKLDRLYYVGSPWSAD